MQDSSHSRGQELPRRPYMHALVRPHRSDPGVWSYDHRVALCTTVIAYLLAAIIFMLGKIDFGHLKEADKLAMDFVDVPQEEVTAEQIQALQAMMQYDDFSDVRNRTSNENADPDSRLRSSGGGSSGDGDGGLNSDLRDAKGTDAAQLYESAGELGGQMAANRAAYEEGLRQEREMIESSRNNRGGGEAQQASDVKEKGRVSVSFSFTDPIRTEVNLIVPSYQCQGGGQIVLVAILDSNGHVVSATVDKGQSDSDPCMQSTAVEAALRSRFNVDNSAPARHRGTISYIFIPQ